MRVKFIASLPAGIKEGDIKNLSPVIAMNMIEKGYAEPAEESMVTAPPDEVYNKILDANEDQEPSEYVYPAEKQAKKPVKPAKIKPKTHYK